MNDDDFAKSIGAVQVSSSSDDDFAKSLGAVPVKQEEGLLAKNVKNTGGSLAAIGDMVAGIPKMGAQIPMALMARAMSHDKNTTLADTWKAAGDLLDENPYVPNIGKLTGTTENPGYQATNLPLQKLGQGIDWTSEKVQQGLSPIVGQKAAGDVAGQVAIAGNLLGADLGVKGIKASVKGVKGFLDAAKDGPIKAPPVTIPDVTAEDLGAIRLDNQSPLPGAAGAFDNIRRQTAGEIPPIQDITNTPMERVTDSLLNGKDQAAVEGAKNAEESSISTNYWKERAAQIQAEEAGTRDANAADYREHATQPDDLAQHPMAVGSDGTVSSQPVMDALSRSTEGITYENVPPDGVIPRDAQRLPNGEPMLRVPRGNGWLMDENGIPVRQGIPESTVAPDYIDKYMHQDADARNDLGNAIQEANGPKLGPDEHYGAGQLETPSPAFNNIINRPYKNSQRGSAPMFEDLTRATADLVKKAGEAFENVAGRGVRSIIGMLPEDHMSKVVGQDMVYKPENGIDAAKKAEAQGPMDTRLWKNVQSGLALAAEKTGSVALKSIGEWLNWSDKRTHLDNRLRVDPIQGKLKKLPQVDFQTLHTLMMDEQRTGNRLTDTSLAGKLSPRAVEAYKALRGALDKAWERNVTTSKALGKDPGTREQAYHASMHFGDFKQSFYNKSGKLVWHVASMDKIAQMKAEAYIRKTVKDIDWEKSKPFFGPDSANVNIPRDVMSAYQNMMKFFDPTDLTTTLISDAINKYNQEHGYEHKGFNERFLDKQNIPGFEGNKPWLSPKENAKAFMNAQLKYLRDSNHWNNLQEALVQMEPILSNEKLIKDQPNIMDTAAAHVSRELGINGNKLAAIEAAWAKYFPKVGIVDGKPTVAFGTSRGNVYKGVADVKTGVYLTMLGANIPYMITTPLQAVMSVAQHRALTVKGFDHNVMKTTINSLADVASGLSKHMMSSMTGKDVAVPISDMGRKLLKYAEDNGIIDKTVMDETGDVRSHTIMDPLKKTLGQTITAPEKIARFSTFVAFAHHLIDSGKLSEQEAFHMAEDFTNHSLTSMRKADKPLIVDKLGSAGQLGYVFKSYLFNEYNQLSQMAGLAKKGSYSPLLAHIGILFALGGALSLPGVNELDGAYDLWKNGVSSMRPQNYKPDLGIKGAILRDMPTWASIGTASQVTGSNLGTRFNTQVANVTNPLSDVAVPIQEGREILSLKDWIMDPTMRNALQAAHANVGSTLKGQMETRLESYKNINKSTPDGRNPDGTMSYRKPSDINDVSTDYKRTPEDEAKRAIGMYSDTEYKTKQIRYANDKEGERIKSAYDKMMKLAITAGVDGNKERATLFSQKALQLDPDPEKYTSKLNQAVIDLGATPEQRDKMKAGRIMELQKVLRATSH